MDLEQFCAEVGSEGPVTCVGGRSQWHVGGSVSSAAREVKAPVGIVEYEPAEMTVRVRAGTTVAELDAALAERGQMVPLDPRDPVRATVGGVLAVGHSGLRRLRYGPVRDAVLEVRYVSADGRLVKTGAPVVKNVTGYDIARLLVGSIGTLGFLAEVVLRCQPRPPVAQWLRSDGADPFEARRRLFRPSAVLWNGASTWVLLEGGAADVEAEAAALAGSWTVVDGPPALPPGRRSMRPGELSSLTGAFVAEVGIGTVHTNDDVPARPLDELHRKIKAAYDPAGRMNPGRRPE